MQNRKQTPPLPKKNPQPTKQLNKQANKQKQQQTQCVGHVIVYIVRKWFCTSNTI